MMMGQRTRIMRVPGELHDQFRRRNGPAPNLFGVERDSLKPQPLRQASKDIGLQAGIDERAEDHISCGTTEAIERRDA